MERNDLVPWSHCLLLAARLDDRVTEKACHWTARALTSALSLVLLLLLRI